MEKEKANRYTCYLCDGRKFNILFPAGEFLIMMCQQCGMVVTHRKGFGKTTPSFDVYFDKQYQTSYLGEVTQQTLQLRAKERLSELEKIIKEKTILDVGCSY